MRYCTHGVPADLCRAGHGDAVTGTMPDRPSTSYSATCPICGEIFDSHTAAAEHGWVDDCSTPSPMRLRTVEQLVDVARAYLRAPLDNVAPDATRLGEFDLINLVCLTTGMLTGLLMSVYEHLGCDSVDEAIELLLEQNSGTHLEELLSQMRAAADSVDVGNLT